jgi:dephospho-CoA kinase
VPVPAAPWLVVEGVGSGAAALAAYVTVLVWVEVDDELRLARGLARDGAEMEQHWRQFMADERALFASERTRERADVLVDGTGIRPPVVR